MERKYEEIKGYYDNGQLAEHYFSDINSDTYNGQFKRWYKDGTPQADCNFEDGKLVGISRWWYPDGKLQMISENIGTDCGFFAEYNNDGAIVEADYVTESEIHDLGDELKGIDSSELTDEFIMMLRLKYYE